MTVGVPALDNDRKKLITLVNMTEHAVNEGDAAPVGGILEELQRYCQEQLDKEEACMIALGFPDIERHTRDHQNFRQGVRTLRANFVAAGDDSARRECAAQAYALLQDWLLTHFLVEDLKLKPLSRRKAESVAADGAKDSAAPAEAGPEQWKLRQRDERRDLPPHLKELLRPLHYVAPQPPAPRIAFPSLERLCEGAISFRVERLLIFFQRRNDAITREALFPFLFSPDFAEKFLKSLQTHIFPHMWTTRRMRLLDTDMDWKGLNSHTFWGRLGEQRIEHVVEAWALAWDHLRLIPTTNDDGTTVMKVREPTKRLRAALAAPNQAAYDLPKIGNREIDVFVALLDPADIIYTRLERLWSVCHDLYVQEMTPQVGRLDRLEGAFRDCLMSAYAALPHPWGDFLILACHRVFPRISTVFVESFAARFGRTDDAREERLPYTMRYLTQCRDMPEMRARELREDAEWQAKLDEWQSLHVDRTAAGD